MSTATRALTEGEQKQVDGVAENLMSGRGFSLVAQSARSIIGYQPPLGFHKQAKVLRILAAGASISDRQATLFEQVIRDHPAAALTPGDAVAKLYDSASYSVKGDFFDLMRASSPEPGRPSDQHSPWTLSDILKFSYILSHAKAAMLPGESPGVGWCEAALLGREGVATAGIDMLLERV